MGAATEMSRLDSLPTETLNSLLSLANSLPTSIKSPKDGDVLVYDGTSKKWKNGESGGGVFWVNFTWDEETDEPIADKTAEEVYTAVESGLLVMGKEGQSGEWTIYRLSGAFHNALTETFTVLFTTQSYSDTVADTSTAYASQFSLADNGVTYTAWSWEVEDAT